MKILYPFSLSFLDYPSNDSHCLSIYVIGCEHNCVECSSPLLQDFNYNSSELIDVSKNTFKALKIINTELKRNHTNAISFMGGDPLHPNNFLDMQTILNNIQYADSMIYTGYPVKYCKENKLKGFTYLKCGVYDITKKQQSEKTDEYFQLASSNQKLYDSKYKLLSKQGRYYFK